MAADFLPIFRALKAHLARNGTGYATLHDTPGRYSLVAAKRNAGGSPVWFGGVQIMKRYVSYHLFAIGADPALLKSLSPGLRKRMQGKACFNLATLDEALIAELGRLTDRYRAAFEGMTFGS
ncbi:MAG TPA: hypothetical protein VGU27_08130 [Candidatus Eisenbacteria bacterium]|nr:hypothetical protein [Candidatus Eisenbacteria bacterium]